jgi:hypothetical protein
MTLRCDDDGPLVGPELVNAMLPRKASKHKLNRIVPETNTGGKVENTKALR